MYAFTWHCMVMIGVSYVTTSLFLTGNLSVVSGQFVVWASQLDWR